MVFIVFICFPVFIIFNLPTSMKPWILYGSTFPEGFVQGNTGGYRSILLIECVTRGLLIYHIYLYLDIFRYRKTYSIACHSMS